MNATMRNDAVDACASTAFSASPESAAKAASPPAASILAVIEDPAHLRQQEVGRQRTGRADEPHAERAASREALGRHREHGRPHVADPGAPDRGRQKTHDGRIRDAQRDQPERRQQAGHPQQPDRRQLVHHRAGEVAHHEHQAAHVDEQPDPGHADGACQRHVHPLPGRKLGRGRQEHRQEPQQEGRGQARPEHFARGNAGGRALGFREAPGREQQEDERGGRQHHDRELVAPVQIERADGEAGDAADDDAARPPRVQHVELVRLVLGIERRRQRIDDRLGAAPPHT